MRDDGDFFLSDLAGSACDLAQILHASGSQNFHECPVFRFTDFLSRIDKPPTAAFEIWGESLAKRSESLFTDGLLRACAKAETEARWSDLGACLSVALSACPPTEDFLRLSIRHLIMVDNSAHVKRTVSDFAARWDRAYGKPWVPEAATSELCHMANERRDSGRTAGVGARRAPLVGRGPELKFLHTRLTIPRTQPQLIVVMGEAGIGKTRIIDEAMRRIRLDGMRILFARGAEFEDCIPLNPIIDVLQQLSGNEFSALGEPWVTVLRGLMPRAHGAPAKAVPPPLRPLRLSRRLMEAFLLLFEQLSARQPFTLGPVPVMGAQSPEIRTILEYRYGQLYSNPVVEVVTNISVNITGAVRSPGHFFLSPSSTLVDALARAGGTSSEVDVGLQGGAADPSQIRLVRGGVGTVIDLRPLEISRDVVNLQVQSGDWIFVPRARRSELRDDINFWNSILTTLLTLATLTYLIQNN